MTCRSNNSFVAASQTDAKIGTVELKPAGFEVKAFYVTDQYGTIIAYDNASTGNTMTFTIPESTTAVVPHFLVDGTCEDLFTLVPTWLGKVQAKMEEYDVSGSGYVVTGKFLTANANTFTVTFPVPENPGSDNIAWVEDQNGDIIYLKDDAPSTDPISATGAAVDKTVLKACRLFEAVMHCSTVDLREAPPPAPPHSPGAMTTSSFNIEKVVGSPKCNVSGTTEGEATGGDYNVTVDGRSCTCSKGELFCLKSTDGMGEYWNLSDGEAIGIALTVSVIVLILIMGLIFLCLQKTTKSTEIVSTLKTDTAEGDDNKL